MNESIRRKEVVVHLIVFVCVLLLLLCEDWRTKEFFFVEDYLVELFLVLALVSFSIYRVSSFLSIYGLFFITSNVFICGRFYSYLILGTDPFVSPVNASYYPTDLEKARLMYYVIIAFAAVHIGYLLKEVFFDYEVIPETESSFFDWLKKNSRKIANAFYIVSIIYVGVSFKSLASVFSSGSYLGLYQFQAEDYSTSIVAVFKIVFVFLFGMVFSIGEKRDRRIALGISLIVGVAYFFIGTRSSLISSILFIVWYFHNYERKLSFLRVALAGCFVVFASQYLIGLTLRGTGVDGALVGPLDLLCFFLYDQGVTLMVFELSFQLPDWPTVIYFQSLLPGINSILSLFGESFGYQYSNAGNFLVYSVNPTAFYNGTALGWSMFGDFAMYSFGSSLGFLAVGALWGAFLSLLESLSVKNIVVRAVTLSTFSSIVISPRGGFGAVFPMMLYYALFWLLFYLIWKRVTIGPTSAADSK